MNSKDKQNLQKRARSKYLTNKIAIPLAQLKSPLEKSYWNTYHCNNILMEHEGKLIGAYCKNRWCLICNRNRIAHLINGYQPQLELLKDPYFVTLTAKTVEGKDLSNRIDEMVSIWRKIMRNKKEQKRLIKGLRKMECTSRPKGLYHPHFHLVIEGKEQAEWVVDQWLRLWRHLAKPQGQDIRPADKNSLLELFKYFTKLTIKTNAADLFKNKPSRVLMHPERMDIIFQAIKGRRVYQTFGGLKKVNEEAEERATIEIDAGSMFKWHDYDWVEQRTGETLSNWVPSEELANLGFEKRETNEEVGQMS